MRAFACRFVDPTLKVCATENNIVPAVCSALHPGSDMYLRICTTMRHSAACTSHAAEQPINRFDASKQPELQVSAVIDERTSYILKSDETLNAQRH